MASAMKMLFQKADFRGAFVQLVDVVHSGRRLLFSKPLTSFKALFHAIDKDAGGTITLDELRNALRRMDVGLPAPQIEAFLKVFDFNEDDAISENEFMSVMSTGERLLKEEGDLEEGPWGHGANVDLDSNRKAGRCVSVAGYYFDQVGFLFKLIISVSIDSDSISLNMLAMQREKLKLQVDGGLSNSFLESIVEKEKIIGELERRIAVLLDRVVKLEQEVHESRARREKSMADAQNAR